MMKLLLTLAALLIGNILYAQQYRITGRIMDETDTVGLAGVSVIATSATDSTLKAGTATDIDGNFAIENLSPGSYTVQASYIGFNNWTKNVTITNADASLGNFQLALAPTTLEGVTVQGQQVTSTQLGDTTQFNAGAYKTNPDANAEDLVSKMPGVTTENGTLKVNGEDVKKILVDGKPFFGDDPNTAIKNLPAEIIDKIQVFDKMSDQSQLTGFDDGQTDKTINIITKPGKNTGQFGKVYGGYGTDNRYLGGGNINFFNGDRRISLIGLFNNINQQNFSTEDLMGVVNQSSGQNRGGQQRGGGGGPRGDGGRGGGNPQGDRGGNNTGNFLVGQQGGITTTNAVGLNYSEDWGKKARVTGSYFFNNTNNGNNTALTRQYITAADSNLIYNEASKTRTNNTNHRLNMRIEYDMDSSNSFIFTPRISIQQNSSDRDLAGGNTVNNNESISRTINKNTADNTGYNFSNNIVYRHKFAKKGRTISASLGTTWNGRDGDGKLYSLSEYTDDTTLLDQEYDLNASGFSLNSNLSYTEPVGQHGQLMANYSPSYSNNQSDKETFNLNTTDQSYNLLDTTLSNKYDNTYTTHRGGLSYRYNTQQYNFSLGVNGQYANLEGQQTFPYAFNIDQSFKNILPMAMFNYKFSRTKNLRIMYRTATNPPSITQLQNVVDNSNPLLLKTGNPDLEQDYSHSMTLRYSATNTSKGSSFFVLFSGALTNNYVANQTLIPLRDTIINGFLVNTGSQISRPVNLDGYGNARSFVTYGFPIKAIKSNLNLNGGVSYTRLPGVINNNTNLSNTYNFNAGFTLGSNISENIDFTLNYSGNYNIVKNTIQSQADNTYYYQTASLRFNWIFLERFVFNTTFNQTLYTGLSQNFNQSYLLWNSYLGYKFLKDRSLEARVSAYDILNQNQAVARTVTETYIEDSNTDVLNRYFMFQLTYTLRNFKNQQPQGTN